MIKDKIIDFTSELEEVDEFYSMVNLIIDQKYVERIKNALKPKKAYLVQYFFFIIYLINTSIYLCSGFI